jgi:formylglycine-generating enzyme required for sulfatase activity
LITAAQAMGDSFGSGANTFEIEFVDVGQPGNAADVTGAPNPVGSVAYPYRIGKFEISESMIDHANALAALGITHDGRGANKAATRVSWLEAARFVNWLNTSTGHSPAYKFNGDVLELWQAGDAGFDPANAYRNQQALYVLPSSDEWYKAAYYDPGSGDYFNFPTGSNAEPGSVASGTDPDTAVYFQASNQGPADITQAGGLSPVGTMAQGGNVWEIEETASDLINDTSDEPRGLRGGSWFNFPSTLDATFRDFIGPAVDFDNIGFRVASVPEPSTLAIGLLGTALLGSMRRTRRTV